MTDQTGGMSPSFVETKGYRRFGEMCDACRRTHVVGLGYGPPGTGKTESAKRYAQWSLFKPFLPEPLITFTGRSATDGLYPYRPLSFASVPLDTSMQECRTVFYTPPVSASVGRIEKEVLTIFAAFSYLVDAANQHHQGREEFLVTRRFSHLVELLIVDEANRLKDAGLELIRDFADRGEFGLVLLGMPGLEKRLMRAPQLYSRVGFAQEIEPLSHEEMHDFLEKRWSHRVRGYSDDFTNKEAVAAIVRITKREYSPDRTSHDASRACLSREPAPGGHQRGGGGRTSESHHWARLSDALPMSCLEIVGFLRQAMCSVDSVLLYRK